MCFVKLAVMVASNVEIPSEVEMVLLVEEVAVELENNEEGICRLMVELESVEQKLKS